MSTNHVIVENGANFANIAIAAGGKASPNAIKLVMSSGADWSRWRTRLYGRGRDEVYPTIPAQLSMPAA